MEDAATRAVMMALKGDARFVGGCVRDTILKRPIRDIDIATPLFPEEVTRRLEAAAIKAIPTGIAHGTITAVAASRPFEITTLRRDVETFGRHATVAFSADWQEDSRRRDFTMNALSMTLDGEVFDYHDGLRDLHAGKVRFVGDPALRIREDVLRLLRFYRFHAWYGRGTADDAARAACRASTPLVPTLSGERLRTEMLKLLDARNPLPSLAMMIEDGVLARMIPRARPLEMLARLIKLEGKPDALRRLGLLIEGDAASIAAKLKLSNAARDRLIGIGTSVDLDGDPVAQHQQIYRLGHEAYADRVLITAAGTGKTETVKPLLAAAKRWKLPVFPLKGADVTALGIAPGPAVGRLLAELEAEWAVGDFQSQRPTLLADLKRRIETTAMEA
jgi:poly(A) polymerase